MQTKGRLREVDANCHGKAAVWDARRSAQVGSAEGRAQRELSHRQQLIEVPTT